MSVLRVCGDLEKCRVERHVYRLDREREQKQEDDEEEEGGLGF